MDLSSHRSANYSNNNLNNYSSNNNLNNYNSNNNFNNYNNNGGNNDGSTYGDENHPFASNGADCSPHVQRRKSLLVFSGNGDKNTKNNVSVVGLSSLSLEIQSQALKRQLLQFLPPVSNVLLNNTTGQDINSNQNNGKSRPGTGTFYTLFSSSSPVRQALKTFIGVGNNNSKVTDNSDLTRKPLFQENPFISGWLPSFSRLKIRNLKYAEILLFLSTSDRNLSQIISLSAFSNLIDGNPENGNLLTSNTTFLLILIDVLLGIKKNKINDENDKNNNVGNSNNNYYPRLSNHSNDKRNSATGKCHLLSQILGYSLPEVRERERIKNYKIFRNFLSLLWISIFFVFNFFDFVIADILNFPSCYYSFILLNYFSITLLLYYSMILLF